MIAPALPLRDPAIRASMLTIFFYGFSGAATAPYQSMVGITELGLPDGFYAVLIFLAAALNVVVSVSTGILADRIGRYRTLMLTVTLFGVSGYGLVFLLPSKASFVVSVLLLLPIYHSINSLLFAQVRSTTDRMADGDAGLANSTVRSALSLSWVLVPGVTAVLLAGRHSMLPAYLVASLAALGCTLLVLLLLPVEEQSSRRGEARAIADIHLSFGALLSPRVLVRLSAIALIGSTLHVNGAILPLILTGQAHGTTTDIGVTVGVVALLEIVFIFLWTRIQRVIGLVPSLCLGAALYALYLGLLGSASTSWHVYALTPLSGFAAAALISIPITYLQDLIRGRPGLGSSLISVAFFMSGGLSAGLFALGTATAGYAATARLGAAAALSGAALLLILDARPAAAIAGSGRTG